MSTSLRLLPPPAVTLQRPFEACPLRMLTLATAVLAPFGIAPVAMAQPGPQTVLNQGGIRYRLTSASTMERGCFPPCMCPIMLGLPLRGELVLRPAPSTTWQYFWVEQLNFTAELGPTTFFITGSGSMRVGPLEPTGQEWTLTLAVRSDPPASFSTFGIVPVTTPFPQTVTVSLSRNNRVCFDTVLNISARAVRPCSLADVVAIGGQTPGDGELTGDDFVAFISAFAQGEDLADVVSIGGVPGPDGLITGDDFNAFIAAFAAGCP